MRYLLDEVSKYEHGYHDMLMPSRSYERHVTFMGDAVTPPARNSCGPQALFPIPLDSNTSSSLCSALIELSPKKIRPQIQLLFAQAGTMGGLSFIFIPALFCNLPVTVDTQPAMSLDSSLLLPPTAMPALSVTAPPSPTKLPGNPYPYVFETPHRSHRPTQGLVFISHFDLPAHSGSSIDIGSPVHRTRLHIPKHRPSEDYLATKRHIHGERRSTHL
jgi:hypothetical protein